jgi:CheY-like chemotaxis protein
MSAETVSEKPQLRVLVVDNEAAWRQAHLLSLKTQGYEVVVAEAARGAADQAQALLDDAVMKAHDQRCHLAVVDLRLRSDNDETDITGLDLVPRLAPTISIMCSGWGDARIIVSALQSPPEPPMRAHAFVGKEDGPHRLHESIERAARKYWPYLYSDVGIVKPQATSIADQTERYWSIEEVHDLLKQLFPKARTLRLETLGSGIRPSGLTLRSRSIVLKATADNEEPVVVKIARAKRVGLERDNYDRFVARYFSGRFYGRHLRSDELWTWGGAVYEFMGSVEPQMRLFTDYYFQGTDRSIIRVLSRFGDNLGKLYRRTRETSGKSLFVAYREAWGSDWCAALEQYRLMVVVPSMFEEWGLTNPIDWIRRRVDVCDPNNRDATRSLPSLDIAITHGDIHGDNMFVDSNKDVWVIDYERSGPGPILQDWVELENDILTRLVRLSGDELSSLLDLAFRVLAPDTIDGVAVRKTDSAEVAKALKVIQRIRRLVVTTTGVEDIRLYLWGLLLNVVFRLIYWHERLGTSEEGQVKVRQCLLLGGLICHRLENIETKAGSWPPAEWLSVQRESLDGEVIARSSTIALDFSYDVFISYSSKDQAWVRNKLLPRLEAAKLRVCIDFRDFQVGAPSVTEMERAVQTSRRILAILTPSYLGSDWTKFEHLMTSTLDPANQERRFIPLLKDRCERPLRIKYLTYVDFTSPDHLELSWKRLLEALAAPLNGA